MRLAVLASHQGTTLQAVIDACQRGHLPAQVVMVISNNSAAGALSRARKANIPTAHISTRTHPDAHSEDHPEVHPEARPEAHPKESAVDQAIFDQLTNAKVDWVLLLGYMKKLGSKTLAAYQGRILNTHPALLPKYGGQGYFGRKVHAAVLAAGERESGATVHLVDSDYDTGPLLSQVRVPVYSNDTVAQLERRVKQAEQKLLINTLIEMSQSRAAVNS